MKSINQYLKLILIEHKEKNQADLHFVDLEYLRTINIPLRELLSNVTN